MVKKFLVLTFSVAVFMSLNSFTSMEDVKPRDWVKIGSKKANYSLDMDVLEVGPNMGSFKKLKLAVSGGNLNMHRMVVHYQNGTKEEVELRQNFSKKSASRTIDLKGVKRNLKKISFVYDTKNGANRKAKIHVFGKR